MRTGVIWLITMEGEVVGKGAKLTTGVRNFSLRTSPFTKTMKKIRLN